MDGGHGTEINYWQLAESAGEEKSLYIDSLPDGYFITQDEGGLYLSAPKLAGPFETLEAAKAAYLLMI